HAHFRVRNHHTCAEPSVWVGHRIDGLLVLARLVCSEFLPGVSREGMTLDSVATADGVGRPEVEWTEVHRIIGASIDTVERDTNKTLLRDVFATNVEFDGAVGELDSRKERAAFTGNLAQPN